MQNQLFVIEPSTDDLNAIPSPTNGRQLDWELDEATKEVGRRGLASARAALRAALSQHETDEPHQDLTAAA